MILLAPTLDRAVQQHRHFTGASNVFWLNELVKYVKSQGLWDDFRVYPMMPRTNFDSGSEVRGLGGLTQNQMTLVNSPTWGSSGIEYGLTGYAKLSLPAFYDADSLISIQRLAPKTASATETTSYYGPWAGDTSAPKSFQYGSLPTSQLTGENWILVNNTGTGKYLGTQQADQSWSANEDFTHVVETTTTSTKLWKDKAQITLSLSLNATTSTDLTPKSLGFTTTDDVYLNAAFTTSVIPRGDNMVDKAYCWMTGTVTDAQREEITDLINQL